MKKDCSKCDGKCCKYVVVEIDKPEDIDDFENIKWFVSHQNVNVFVDEGEWFLEFLTPCKYLNEKNLCTNYEKRPQICRDYHVGECTFHNNYSQDHTFSSPKDVEDYIQNVWKNKNKSSSKFKSRKS